jgi:hypothetical protein
VVIPDFSIAMAFWNLDWMTAHKVAVKEILQVQVTAAAYLHEEQLEK